MESQSHLSTRRTITRLFGKGPGERLMANRNNRGYGKVIGFLILVCIVILLTQYKQIEKWLPGGTSIKLNTDLNSPSLPLCVSTPNLIPEHSGDPAVELNDNIPSFTEYDLTHVEGESYSDLDALGRCGSAVAMLDQGMMPTEERGDIGMIRPSGWHQEKYPGIIDSNPPFLYNRCHLIAYAMTGQNANEKNLITGTRYMNTEGMLPYERKVLRYLDDHDDQVLYRVTPYFSENELLARGVEMEAYSVEDEGVEICFHVFVYNVQPGIIIDYQTGENRAA